MPVLDLTEARDVDQAIEAIVRAPSSGAGMDAARALFVERLDFAPATGSLTLAGQGLPASANRIAQRGGVQVVGVELPADGRVRASELQAVLRQIRQTLNGEILLVATERTRSQWHFVFPGQRSSGELLRRMVVHAGQPRRTVVQQLAGVYRDVERGADLLTALEDAYDVEAVTKRFFHQYREIFGTVMGLMGLVGGLPDEEERKLFCQLLFNRLMFIYFLQRKGWLTFNGDADYLEALWRDAQKKPEENFYKARLWNLFFVALNNPRDANWDKFRYSVEPLIGQVPFLNGGLFAETELDRRPGVTVPNEVIRLILRDLFARFNFTITESTPYDIEVAVDPEMLGKIFEELVTGRHETGSYYTPRPIVSFMCREALKRHLLTHVDDLAPDLASAFVDDHEVSGLTMQQAREILGALEAVTVLDPACGSGAYLLGMLHELIELQRLLYSSALVHDAKSLYDLKLRVIANNVYGVDNDPFAINIAMLRLWLSLVIEYEGPRDPPALPNLDFKIVCGDSLSAPNPSIATELFRTELQSDARELARLKAEHMRAYGEEKRVLRERIDEKKNDICVALQATAPSNAVDWRVEFAEVIDINGGFDVVIANPPYVRMELFKDQKPILRKNFPSVHADRADLYCYFYGRAVELLRTGGVLVFISSNKWLRADYGANLRGYMAAQVSVSKVIDFGELPIFQSAATFPMILIARKGRTGDIATLTEVKSLDAPYPDLLAIVRSAALTLPPDAINGSKWRLADAGSLSRLQKMESSSVPLASFVGGQILYGIKSGFNAAFIISGDVRRNLLSRNPAAAEVIKPFIRGDDVRRWRLHDRDSWILYLHSQTAITRYPEVAEYLSQFRPQLENRATKQEWWRLQQPQVRYSAGFEKPKILFPDISREPRFCFDTTGAYIDTTVFAIPTTDLYLLAVLNSAAVWSFLQRTAAVLGDADSGGRLRLKLTYVRAIPIPNVSPSERAALAGLAHQMCDQGGQGELVSALEAEINERVARLYGLEEVSAARPLDGRAAS